MNTHTHSLPLFFFKVWVLVSHSGPLCCVDVLIVGWVDFG